MAVADPLRELAPAVGYDAPWGLVGLALVAVVLAWHTGVWWCTRPARARVGDRSSPLARRWRAGRLRRRAVRAVAALDAQRSAGKVADRDAHLALSALVRGLAEDLGAVPARSLALDDLARAAADEAAGGDAGEAAGEDARRPLAATVAAVALTYPPGFARDGVRNAGVGDHDPAADAQWGRALAAAREAVAAWR